PYSQLSFPINAPAPAKRTRSTPDTLPTRRSSDLITFTASASGGTAPYQFKWWLWNGSAWNTVQDWSAGATFVWTPTVANPGYQILAWARSAAPAASVSGTQTPPAFPINAPAPAKL